MSEGNGSRATIELTGEELSFIHGALNVLWRCPKCEAGLYNSRKTATMADVIQKKIEGLSKEKRDETVPDGGGVPAPVGDGVRKPV